MSPALPPPPDCPTMQEHWCVSVMAEGDTLVTIGHNWLSGKGELTDEETQTVIGAASHLLSFVGYGLPQTDFDPDAEEIPPLAVTDAALIEALQIGLECAVNVAANVHEEWRGHRPELHAEADADVAKVRAVIESLKAATPTPEHFPDVGNMVAQSTYPADVSKSSDEINTPAATAWALVFYSESEAKTARNFLLEHSAIQAGRLAQVTEAATP